MPFLYYLLICRFLTIVVKKIRCLNEVRPIVPISKVRQVLSFEFIMFNSSMLRTKL